MINGWIKLCLGLAGLVLVSTGAALIYLPAGLIVFGAGIIAAVVEREADGMAGQNLRRTGDHGHQPRQ